MKLSVCIEMVCNEPVFADRIHRVKEAGLDYFEFWGWHGKDIAAIKAVSNLTGVRPSVFCTAGGPLVDKEARNNYLTGLEETLKIAADLNVKTLITTTGNELPNIPRSDQHSAIVETLRAAAPILEDSGVTLVLEPLNILVDHKGYYLSSSDEAFQIIEEVNSPNVKVLFDIYHQQITEGHIISRITQNISKIGHFHVADNPGRHEPGTGELNYATIFKAIDDSGYQGYVGLEYSPTKDAVTTLKEIAKLAIRR